MATMIICAECGVSCKKESGHVNRARRQGKKLYCSSSCAHACRRIDRTKLTPLTIARARALFRYNLETGVIVWAEDRGGPIKAGDQAGCIDTKGHRRIYCEGRSYASTHIIWAIVYGRWPSNQVDHENRQPNDDRFLNLREATPSQNCANRAFPTKAKGVSLHKGSGKYHARVQARGKLHFLGSFNTSEEAAAAYDLGAIKLHGEFALTNAMMEGRL